MTAAEAIYGFWSSFGVPAYEENAVPDGAGMPYLTYRYAEGAEFASLTASLWSNSASWVPALETAGRISASLGRGGVTIPLGGTALLWILRDEPFSESLGTAEEPYVKRILFRVRVRVFR